MTPAEVDNMALALRFRRSLISACRISLNLVNSFCTVRNGIHQTFANPLRFSLRARPSAIFKAVKGRRAAKSRAKVPRRQSPEYDDEGNVTSESSGCESHGASSAETEFRGAAFPNGSLATRRRNLRLLLVEHHAHATS